MNPKKELLWGLWVTPKLETRNRHPQRLASLARGALGSTLGSGVVEYQTVGCRVVKPPGFRVEAAMRAFVNLGG